jgi:ABC-type uncharacterized transport system substrate-binding protein
MASIYWHQFQQAAVYVDRILRGAQPAELPVQYPTKFQLVINLMTAKLIGLTRIVVLRPDELIEVSRLRAPESGRVIVELHFGFWPPPDM